MDDALAQQQLQKMNRALVVVLILVVMDDALAPLNTLEQAHKLVS